MKVNINKAELVQSLSIVGMVVDQNTNLIEQTCVNIEAKEGSLFIKTFNNEEKIQLKALAQIIEEGSVFVSYRHINEIIKKLKDGVIEISKDNDDEKEQIIIKAEYAKFTLKTISEAMFPKSEKIDEQWRLEITQEELYRAAKMISFIDYKDDINVSAKGILLQSKANKLRLVVTNIKSFVYSEAPIVSKGEEVTEVKVTKRFMNTIIGMPKTKQIATIIYTNNEITYNYMNISYTSRVIKGSFIKYESLVPQTADTTITGNRQNFLQVIDRVSVMCKSDDNIILTTDKNTCTCSISAQTNEEFSATEKLNMITTGEDVEFIITKRDLIESVKHFPEEDIIINYLKKPQDNSKAEVVILKSKNNDFLFFAVAVVKQEK